MSGAQEERDRRGGHWYGSRWAWPALVVLAVMFIASGALMAFDGAYFGVVNVMFGAVLLVVGVMGALARRRLPPAPVEAQGWGRSNWG